jgi:aldehyde dehydrogenase
MDERLISRVVAEVVAKLQLQQAAVASGQTGFGVYERMDDAIEASHRSFLKLKEAGVSARKKAVAVIRRLCVQNAKAWGEIEFRETKIGRLDHKIEKLKICGDLVPGVEFLERQAFSGDFGLTIIDFAPWGVVGAITPSTHSVPTLTGNAINIIAAGNSVVYNTHPSACQVAALAIRAYNEAIFQETGIPDLLATVVKPTLESFDVMCKHPKVPLLCVTGGPAVVKAAMKSGKRAVCAGPGNPPVVVDETADIDRAARCIIQGASYDNNLLCIGEKQVFVVEAVADKLIAALKRAGAVQLNATQIETLGRKAFGGPDGKEIPGELRVGSCGHAVLNKQLVGADAAVLAKFAGLEVPGGTQLLFGETSADHLWVQEEQMMPFIPVVRVKDVDTAIDLAIESEHGYKHTAIMHSQSIRNLTRMAQAADTTLFIKNGPCMTGLGLGGEGFLSFSIATPTGEGVTTPMTFTRSRRCVMVENLNMF